MFNIRIIRIKMEYCTPFNYVETNELYLLYSCKTNTSGLRCSGTNAFINFWLQFFDTRRETILKNIS